MDTIKQRQNLGYLIAGIGALVALLAILLLPYAAVSVDESATIAGVFYHVNATVTLNATAIAQSLGSIFNSSSTSSSNTPQVQNQGALWLLPILALIGLVLTGLVLFRDHPFGKGVKAPLAMQKRWGNYGLIGVAALSVLLQIVLFSNLSSQIQTVVKASISNTLPSSVNASVNTGTLVGFWLFLLGMVATAGGAIFLLVQERRQMQTMPNMSGGQPYQTPLDPYSQQYPPQQAQSYMPQQQEPYAPQQPQPAQPYSPQQAQPYPPQQPQQYPSQQWPPSSNQPPYPPGQ